MQIVIAAQAIAVPKVGLKDDQPDENQRGRTAGSRVLRQSSIDRLRVSRKNARKRISAGLASSEGWNENPAEVNPAMGVMRAVEEENRYQH